MKRAILAEERLLQSWQDYQDALLRAIAPLSAEQMQRRFVPTLRTPGEIAEHIVFGRALWLHRTLGETVAEVKPLLRWDDADDAPHGADEVVQGLELTWQLIRGYLMRGSAEDEIPADEVTIRQTLWGMLDHDLPHAGELALLLGMAGLPTVEI